MQSDLESILDDNDRLRNAAAPESKVIIDATTGVWRGKKQHTGYLAEIPVPKCVSTPVTLGEKSMAHKWHMKYM